MGRCYNSAVIRAPRNEAWDRIKNFHDLSWAAGVIAKVETIRKIRLAASPIPQVLL